MECGIASQPVYQEKYSFGSDPIMGVLATALCIVALVFLDDLPIGDDSETTREIVRYVLYFFTFFGVFGTVRSLVLAIKKRTALKVDESGVTTTGSAFTAKVSQRKTVTTRWNRIDILIVENRRRSANAGESHFRVCCYSEAGEAEDLVPSHKIVGHGFDWGKLRDVAKHYRPQVTLEERDRDGSDVRIKRAE